jgi:hypothetical protein
MFEFEIIKGMKLLTYALLFFIYSNRVYSQNLVNNPSFEQIDTCYTNCENTTWVGFEYVRDWSDYNTADLMASCNRTDGEFAYNCIDTSVPLNWQGYQYPRSGENYAGYGFGVKEYSSSNLTNTFREYLIGSLSSSLVANKKYCFSFYVSQGASLYFKYAIGLDSNYLNYLVVDKIGLKFYKAVPPFENPSGAIVLTPDLNMRPDSMEMFSDTSNWMKSTEPYIASGGEQYFIIGNLYPGNNVSSEFISDLDKFWQSQFTGASCYHYIDDIELIEIPDIVVSSSDSAIFEGESVILSANQIAEEQVWLAEDTTVAIGTGLSVEVSPTVSSTYYLRSLQCKLFAWDTVYVKVRQPLPPPFEPLKLFISNTISKENFLINYTGDERPLLTLALFNSIGQLVYVQNITETASITTSGYAPGIYYCRIYKNSESVLTEKIVVMK